MLITTIILIICGVFIPLAINKNSRLVNIFGAGSVITLCASIACIMIQRLFSEANYQTVTNFFDDKDTAIEYVLNKLITVKF